MPPEISKAVTQKVVNRLLPSHGTLTMSASRFNANIDEYVLSYRDVKHGKLVEIWELQKNPFKYITDTLYNMEVNSYEMGAAADSGESVESWTRSDAGGQVDLYMEEPAFDYEEVPVKYRKILKGFAVSMVKEYMRDTLMKLFYRVTGGRIEMSVLEANIKKSLLSDSASAGEARLAEFSENPSYVAIWKKERTFKTLDSYLESLDNVAYYPSFYEARVWADLCGVNMITLGHKTLKNPDGIKLFMNGSDKYMILLHSYDRFNLRDRFDVISLRGKKEFVYRRDEIPDEFMSIIDKKSQTYEIAT